jgi:large subunit ribosomal protein L4
MSIKVKLYNQKAEVIGEESLSAKVFGVKVSEPLVHQAMVTQMANERQVLAHTKGRSEVRGGGKKPWRQKGTGRARAGSSRSPIWIGGGVTFGPLKTRNFKKDINKKMKQKALCMVLSDRAKETNFAVLDKLDVNEFKTKVFNSILKSFEDKILNSAKVDSKGEKIKVARSKIKRSILIINDKPDEQVKFSSRNLAGVKVLNIDNINILDLLKYKNLFLTLDTIKKLEARYK